MSTQFAILIRLIIGLVWGVLVKLSQVTRVQMFMYISRPIWGLITGSPVATDSSGQWRPSGRQTHSSLWWDRYRTKEGGGGWICLITVLLNYAWTGFFLRIPSPLGYIPLQKILDAPLKINFNPLQTLASYIVHRLIRCFEWIKPGTPAVTVYPYSDTSASNL